MSESPIDDPMLLGYLLGILDADETKQVELAVERDSAVASQLEYLRQRFASVLKAGDADVPEPSGDLARRTVTAIGSGRSNSTAVAATRCKMFSRLFSGPPIDVDSLESSTGRSGVFRNLLELSVFAMSVLVFGCVTLSWALQTQERARRQRCAFQLANLGIAIQDYAFHRQDQIAPEVDLDGPLAFAGVYAPRLNNQQLLNRDDCLWCPNSSETITFLHDSPVDSLPSLAQLMAANDEQLKAWQRWIGGSYAYNLGVFSDGRYQTPRFLSRANFAIMGDSPTIENGQIKWNSHGINLCNVLFEDGHVKLVYCGPRRELIGHPFLNDEGNLKAGLNDQDSAMGPSFYRPLEGVRLLPTSQFGR